MELAALAAQAESVDLPDGDAERFAGYGVMGLPFSSGHVHAVLRSLDSTTLLPDALATFRPPLHDDFGILVDLSIGPSDSEALRSST